MSDLAEMLASAKAAGIREGRADAIASFAKFIADDVDCEVCPVKPDCKFPCWRMWEDYLTKRLEEIQC